MQQIRDYLFSDLRTNKIYPTPAHIAEEMVNALPADLWNDPTLPKKRFLDICCKSGIFLIKLRDKLMTAPAMVKAKPDEKERLKYILEDMLYGIAPCKLCEDISRIELYGKVYEHGNIVTIADTYIEYLDSVKEKDDIKIDGKQKKLLRMKKRIAEEFKIMKFDVVIGNPPYNDDETSKSSAIYSKFVTVAIENSRKYVSFIIPARWYVGGRGLKQFRQLMLSERHVSTLVDYPNEKDVFNNVSIPGGVCYFIYDQNYTGDCRVITKNKDIEVYNSLRDLSKYDIFIRDIQGLAIIEKVMDRHGGNLYLESGVQSVDYFGVKDNIYVHGDKRSDDEIPIADASGYLYTDRGYLNDPYNLIDGYNCIVTHAVGSEGYVFPNTLRVLEKGEACSVTYLCIGYTQERYKAENLLKYLKTRFLRFLVYQLLSGINISSKSFKFVPVQDFSNNSDIDWSKSITEIDEQLFGKYKLEAEEVDYIKATIKPMDTTAQKQKPTKEQPSKPQITARDGEAAIVKLLANSLKDTENNK